MPNQAVRDLLAAWRAAERTLEEADDPADIDVWAAEVERLRREYRLAVNAMIEQDGATTQDAPSSTSSSLLAPG